MLTIKPATAAMKRERSDSSCSEESDFESTQKRHYSFDSSSDDDAARMRDSEYQQHVEAGLAEARRLFGHAAPSYGKFSGQGVLPLLAEHGLCRAGSSNRSLFSIKPATAIMHEDVWQSMQDNVLCTIKEDEHQLQGRDEGSQHVDSVGAKGKMIQLNAISPRRSWVNGGTSVSLKAVGLTNLRTQDGQVKDVPATCGHRLEQLEGEGATDGTSHRHQSSHQPGHTIQVNEIALVAVITAIK
jgi:hypothetical protein